jgi:hypothetical protein
MNEIYKMVLRNTFNHISSKANRSLPEPESIFEFAYYISIMFAKSSEDVVVDYLVVNNVTDIEVKNGNDK